MPPPLDVFSDLQLDVDGENIDIFARGDEIVVDLPSLRAGRRLLFAEHLLRGVDPGRPQRLHDVLQEMGLTVDVRLTGESIARMGSRAEPGRLEMLLNLDGVEVHPVRSVKTAWRRWPILLSVVGAVLALAIGGLLVRAFLSSPSD